MNIKTLVNVSLLYNCIFRRNACTRVDRYRAHTVSCSVGGSGSFVVLGICGTRVRSCVSDDIDCDRLKGAGGQKCFRLCGKDTFRICERWRNPYMGQPGT